MADGDASFRSLPVSRRNLLVGAGAFFVPPFCTAWAQSNTDKAPDPKAIAIVDTPQDTRCYLDRLVAQGVRVIGRYYARQWQSILPEKRLSQNMRIVRCADKRVVKTEAAAILDNELAILSVYQYNSDSPLKYLFGIDRNGNPIRTGRRNTNHLAIARAEADLDAAAAKEQAQLCGQPAGTAIMPMPFDPVQR